MRTASLAVLLLLALAAPARAKGLIEMKVCGSDRCVDITQWATPTMVDGTPSEAPPAGAAYVKMHFKAAESGGVDRWTSRFYPATGTVLGPTGLYTRLDATAATALRQSAREVEAFRPAGSTPAPRAPAPDDFPWLPVVAGAALAAVAALTLRRRVTMSA